MTGGETEGGGERLVSEFRAEAEEIVEHGAYNTVKQADNTGLKKK